MAWKKGQSGNPTGRPSQIAVVASLRDQIKSALPEIIAVLIESARNGDATAAKVLLDRSLPVLKPQSDTVSFTIASNDTLATIGQSIIDAASRGDVAPDVASQLLIALANQGRIVETTDLAKRIEALEGKPYE